MFLGIINGFHKMTLTLQCMNLYSASTKFFHSYYYFELFSYFKI